MGQAMAREALVLEDLARAKVNLTLSVLGRRPDGFHELDSIVAFADMGDRVRLVPGKNVGISVTGRFASSIIGPNLALRALELLAEAEPRLTLGLVEIEKCLPVAAGLGGGSADAAAVLRLVRQANPDLADAVDWATLALRLGSDVLVCFGAKSCRMQGRGETITPLPYDIDVPAVLVNTQAQMPADKTARIFKAFGAPELADRRSRGAGHFAGGRNDLEGIAEAKLPGVREVLAVLRGLETTRWARLSGAGATCFAVYDSPRLAELAASEILQVQPDWWVVPVRLT